MNGFLFLHRKIINSPIFENPELLKVWIWCLCKANYVDSIQPIGNQNVLIKAGQFATGRKKAGIELGEHQSKVWRYLKQLEMLGNIVIESNNKYSLVTVAKWGDYQAISDLMDNKCTTDEQQMNNRCTTDEQQTAQQMNTNNNINNNQSISNKNKLNNDKGNTKNINNTLVENAEIFDESDDGESETGEWTDEMKFDATYKIYPRKEGKAKGRGHYLGFLKGRKLDGIRYKLSAEDMYYAVERYAEKVKGREQKHIMMFSSFMNKPILDYLEGEP